MEGKRRRTGVSASRLNIFREEVNEGLRTVSFGASRDEIVRASSGPAADSGMLSFDLAGAPLYNAEMEAMANRGLEAALTQVNSVYAVSNLYRVTQGSVTRVIPVGLSTVDLMMTFVIKETECTKESRNDPQTCAFRPGFFVPSFSCSSRVRTSATSTQVIALRCGQDGSSSSESSEEVFSRGRHHFNTQFANRVPAPSAPPPPTQPERSVQSRTEDVWSRGDTFNNYLV